jgi:hypothetical protein
MGNEASILQWLLQQAPVIGVMGLVIWWLAARFTKKDTELQDLSKEVMRLVALWEAKSDTFITERSKFMEILEELAKGQNNGTEEVLGRIKTATEKIDLIIEAHKTSSNNELREIKNQLVALVGSKAQ